MVPVEEAMAKVSGWKGEKWRSRIAEGWVTVWTSVLCLYQSCSTWFAQSISSPVPEDRVKATFIGATPVTRQ